MATVSFPSNLRRLTGEAQVTVAAGAYRDLINELCARYPELSEEVLRKQAIAIDGRVVQEPLLETFGADSELVFVTKIAGG